MPKGRHKGATRRFTNFKAEELKSEKEQKKAEWRAQRGELSSDEESGSGSEESSEESSSDEEGKERKAKGISGLIQLENPNRPIKTTKKVTELTGKEIKRPEMTRRQREEYARQNYEAMHAAGKTDQARADLERLAIIRQRREEADQKRKEQLEAKAAAAAESSAKTKKTKS